MYKKHIEEKHKKLNFSTHSEELPKSFVKPKIKRIGKKRDWVAGGRKSILGAIDRQPDSDWTDIIDQLDYIWQNQFCETFDCYSWNVYEALRLILQNDFQDGAEKYSRRYGNVMSNGTPSGGSVSAGLSQIYASGCLIEERLPWLSSQNTWSKFHSPSVMPQVYIDEAKKWLRKYSFNYDWVVYPSIFGRPKTKMGMSIQDAMFQTLKNSPLVSAFYAWSVNSNGLCYHPNGVSYNHMSVISGAVYGKYWVVHDSYPNCWRKVDWNYPFKYVARLEVGKSTKPQEDAQYIIDTMFGTNVKGDSDPAIYYIYGGQKLPYPSGQEYNLICDNLGWDKDKFTIVAQDAIDIIPEGQPMYWENIKNAEPFNTIKELINK